MEWLICILSLLPKILGRLFPKNSNPEIVGMPTISGSAAEERKILAAKIRDKFGMPNLVINTHYRSRCFVAQMSYKVLQLTKNRRFFGRQDKRI